jgi:hypothetical protein
MIPFAHLALLGALVPLPLGALELARPAARSAQGPSWIPFARLALLGTLAPLLLGALGLAHPVGTLPFAARMPPLRPPAALGVLRLARPARAMPASAP